MRTVLAALLIAAAIPTAAAAQTIDERQNNLFRRIEEGVRNNALTREEAQRLRNEFYEIAELERRYRYDGLDQRERQDLNRRFDDLSRRIDRERADNERVPQALYERRAQLDRNVQEGIRGGGLSRREVDQIDYEMRAYDQRLREYRRSGDGIDSRERADLERELQRLAQRILDLRRNGEQGGRNDYYRR